MTTINRNNALSSYIEAIRNPAKKEFARAVASYGPDSTQALSKRGALSYMARQAVCMRVADIEATK